ncbi:hypothetical protein DPEC_G00379920, partial [Dallia pectoralis]
MEDILASEMPPDAPKIEAEDIATGENEVIILEESVSPPPEPNVNFDDQGIREEGLLLENALATESPVPEDLSTDLAFPNQPEGATVSMAPNDVEASGADVDILDDIPDEAPEGAKIEEAVAELPGLEQESSKVAEVEKNKNEVPEVEKDPNEVPEVENDLNEVPEVEKGPNAVPAVEKDANEVPEVENDTIKVPEVENDPNEVPEVENDLNEVPEVENDTIEVPEVENDPNEVPEVENDTIEVPEVENDPNEVPEVETDQNLPTEVETDRNEVPEVEKYPKEFPEVEKDPNDVPEVEKNPKEVPEVENEMVEVFVTAKVLDVETEPSEDLEYSTIKTETIEEVEDSIHVETDEIPESAENTPVIETVPPDQPDEGVYPEVAEDEDEIGSLEEGPIIVEPVTEENTVKEWGEVAENQVVDITGISDEDQLEDKVFLVDKDTPEKVQPTPLSAEKESPFTQVSVEEKSTEATSPGPETEDQEVTPALVPIEYHPGPDISITLE